MSVSVIEQVVFAALWALVAAGFVQEASLLDQLELLQERDEVAAPLAVALVLAQIKCAPIKARVRLEELVAQVAATWLILSLLAFGMNNFAQGRQENSLEVAVVVVRLKRVGRLDLALESLALDQELLCNVDHDGQQVELLVGCVGGLAWLPYPLATAAHHFIIDEQELQHVIQCVERAALSLVRQNLNESGQHVELEVVHIELGQLQDRRIVELRFFHEKECGLEQLSGLLKVLCR